MNIKKASRNLRQGLTILMLMIVMAVTAVTGCTNAATPQSANQAITTQVESSEGGNEAGGEHGAGGEGNESGGEHNRSHPGSHRR